AEIDRLLAIPSPPPSPLSPWSSPLPQIPSPPLPVSPPLRVSSLPLPASPTYPLGYRAAMIWLRAETPSTSHPLPSERMFLMLPYRLERGCVESSFAAAARPTRGLRADYGFIATLDDEIRHEPERDVGYEITDMWDEMLVGMPGALVTDDTELGRRMTDFTTTRDRRDHARTARLLETEAKLSRQAWVQSMDASDIARSKVMALHTQKMTPKRTTRSTPAITTTTTTTFVTDYQLKALINQGIGNALAARNADRSRNGKDSHDSGMGVMR
nr:hypothetical protein [Tanacetum cinerariifolium]